MPEIDGRWEKQYFYPEPDDREPYWLYVGYSCFRHISYDDVMAALSDLEDGKYQSFLLRTPSGSNGYMEVGGCRGSYTVRPLWQPHPGILPYTVHVQVMQALSKIGCQVIIINTNIRLYAMDGKI